MERETKKNLQTCFQNHLSKTTKICSYFGLLLTDCTDTGPGTRPNLQLIRGKKVSMAFYLYFEEKRSKFYLSKTMLSSNCKYIRKVT